MARPLEQTCKTVVKREGIYMPLETVCITSGPGGVRARAHYAPRYTIAKLTCIYTQFSEVTNNPSLLDY